MNRRTDRKTRVGDRRVRLLHDRHRQSMFTHADAVSEREPEQMKLGGEKPTAGADGKGSARRPDVLE